MVVGSLHFQQMTWLRSADASMVLALEIARICLVVLGCAAAPAPILGAGSSSRRYPTDARSTAAIAWTASPRSARNSA